MLKVIGGVLLGYLVIFVFVFATFTIAFLAMGADGAFQPGSYEVSTLWLAVSIVLSAAAALLGGYLSARIAGGIRAAQVLAGLVLVLGILFALPALMGSPAAAQARAGGVGNLEAMQKARQPTWTMLMNPLIGAAGVMAGASLTGGARRTDTA